MSSGPAQYPSGKAPSIFYQARSNLAQRRRFLVNFNFMVVRFVHVFSALYLPSQTSKSFMLCVEQKDVPFLTPSVRVKFGPTVVHKNFLGYW